jgi:hypothetical protein
VRADRGRLLVGVGLPTVVALAAAALDSDGGLGERGGDDLATSPERLREVKADVTDGVNERPPPPPPPLCALGNGSLRAVVTARGYVGSGMCGVCAGAFVAVAVDPEVELMAWRCGWGGRVPGSIPAGKAVAREARSAWSEIPEKAATCSRCGSDDRSWASAGRPGALAAAALTELGKEIADGSGGAPLWEFADTPAELSWRWWC